MSQSYEELLSQVRGGRQVTADSRKAAPGCVFVAVRGATEDGTKHVPQAVKAGATAVVTDESAPEPQGYTGRPLGNGLRPGAHG